MATTPSVRRRRAALALVAAASIALVACDDDDAPSEEAYVEAGNQLCEETGAALEEAFPDFEGEPSLEQVMDLGAALGPIMQGWRDGVADLDPPADLEDGHQVLLDELDDSIAALEEMTTPEGAQAALDGGGPPLDAPATAAHALFPSCPAGEE